MGAGLASAGIRVVELRLVSCWPGSPTADGLRTVVSGWWGAVLAAVFLVTGGCSLWRLIQFGVQGSGGRVRAPAAERLVDLNHLVMSAVMVLMLWRPAGQVATLVQIAIFGLFGAVFLLRLLSDGAVPDRLGYAAHLAMNVAMVWMLAAVPWMTRSSRTHSAHHHGAGRGELIIGATAPGWAQSVSMVAVVGMVVVALWWLGRALLTDRERTHLCCHGVMSVGMVMMLAAMG